MVERERERERRWLWLKTSVGRFFLTHPTASDQPRVKVWFRSLHCAKLKCGVSCSMGWVRVLVSWGGGGQGRSRTLNLLCNYILRCLYLSVRASVFSLVWNRSGVLTVFSLVFGSRGFSCYENMLIQYKLKLLLFCKLLLLHVLVTYSTKSVKHNWKPIHLVCPFSACQCCMLTSLISSCV